MVKLRKNILTRCAKMIKSIQLSELKPVIKRNETEKYDDENSKRRKISKRNENFCHKNIQSCQYSSAHSTDAMGNKRAISFFFVIFSSFPLRRSLTLQKSIQKRQICRFVYSVKTNLCFFNQTFNLLICPVVF